MRKKVGELIREDKQAGKEFKSTIWGSIFKTDDDKMLGGIHINIYPSEVKDCYPIIQSIMQICEGIRFKFVEDDYGTRYRLSYYGDLSYFDANKVLEMLKDVPVFDNDDYKLTLNITKDFDFVVESKMIRDL